MLQSASTTVFCLFVFVLCIHRSKRTRTTRNPLGRLWLRVHGMHSVTTEPLSDVIHNRNGDNMTNIVAKLVEKTDAEMAGKYVTETCYSTASLPPPPFIPGVSITLYMCGCALTKMLQFVCPF